MENNNIVKVIYAEGKSFLKAASNINENVYFVLFTLYVLINFIINIEWGDQIQGIVSNIRYGLLSIVMWGATVYLFYVICEWISIWKHLPIMMGLAVLMLLATGWFSHVMTTNSYGVVMDLFFCIMAYGKNYRKLLKCLLTVSIVMLIIAAIGVPTGITEDLIKPDNIHPGHSLGIIYPNTWGNLVYLNMILLWYLYLRHKPIITICIFWVAGAFMFLYIYSRTMSFFSVMFPVGAVIVDYFQRRSDRKEKISALSKENVEINPYNRKLNNRIGLFGWIVVAIPLLSFVFVIFASRQMDWVHQTFYYTWFHNFAMRFVQGGLYLQTYGMPLFGNPYRSNITTFRYVNGEYLQLGNLDSSFISYLIMRGLIWIICVLVWLCIAHWKALKNRDYAIPYIGGAILFVAMMERIGLEMWYNFILLYPLAKVDGSTYIIEELNQMKTDYTADTSVSLVNPKPEGNIEMTDGQENMSVVISAVTKEAGDDITCSAER